MQGGIGAVALCGFICSPRPEHDRLAQPHGHCTGRHAALPVYRCSLDSGRLAQPRQDKGCGNAQFGRAGQGRASRPFSRPCRRWCRRGLLHVHVDTM